MRAMRTNGGGAPFRGAMAVLAVSALWLATALPALAHGPTPADPPDAVNLTFGWSFEPLVTLGIVPALLVWRWAVRSVNAAHPHNPVPAQRTWTFVGAMLTIAVALMSGIERYDTTLFSLHMVQHIL